MSRNDEQIGALERELAGYEKYGKTERAAQVREQIRALGGDAASPVKRGRGRKAPVETASSEAPEDMSAR